MIFAKFIEEGRWSRLSVGMTFKRCKGGSYEIRFSTNDRAWRVLAVVACGDDTRRMAALVVPVVPVVPVVLAVVALRPSLTVGPHLDGLKV